MILLSGVKTIVVSLAAIHPCPVVSLQIILAQTSTGKAPDQIRLTSAPSPQLRILGCS
jgi:hypothetical protein